MSLPCNLFPAAELPSSISLVPYERCFVSTCVMALFATLRTPDASPADVRTTFEGFACCLELVSRTALEELRFEYSIATFRGRRLHDIAEVQEAIVAFGHALRDARGMVRHVAA